MKRMTTKNLALMAMFIALQVVLSKFLMVQLTPAIRLSVDAVPVLLCGLWLGPLAGGITGGVADLVGTILFPTAGAYYPPLTVAFILLGILSGLLGRFPLEKATLPRTALMVLPAEFAASLLYKSFALSMLTGTPFSVLLAARALPVCGVAVMDTLLVYAVHRLVGLRLLASAAPREEILFAPEEMTYTEALDYIHHVTWRGSRLGLERTRELLSRMGDPQKTLKFVHVAGTNGKGSTVAMLSGMLRQAGYRTGMYISPFINRFNERMQIDGACISDEELAAVTAYVRPFADAMADHPTEFELITVIALEYFHRHACDVVVLEVGMGGELDSTNVIDTPELAVITSIGLDHTRELGPTIRDIARAKAGIIKEGGTVVIYDQNPEADEVFASVCQSRHGRLIVTDHSAIRNVAGTLEGLTFDYGPYQGLRCSLVGAYQTHNAAVAITAAQALREKGWRIGEQEIRKGLSQVRWPARFEVLLHKPLFIADGGHNPQGIEAAVESLGFHFPGKKVVFLLGIMADKDIPHMIGQLGAFATAFVTVTPHNPRAMAAEELAEKLSPLGCPVTAMESVEAGVDKAIQLAGVDGIVCALGSLYMLGDVRAYVKKSRPAAEQE